MKRKLVAALSTIVATIALGYLFLLCWLLGLLASKYIAGKSAGERGKVRPIIIRFRRWKIHIHHWLYSSCLIGLIYATGIHFMTPAITYGLLGGLVFQGIYCYSDWHMVLISEHKTRARPMSLPLDLEATIGRVKEERSPS